MLSCRFIGQLYTIRCLLSGISAMVWKRLYDYKNLTKSSFEPRHEISKNVVCATSKDSDQPAHTRSLIRAFATRLNIL